MTKGKVLVLGSNATRIEVQGGGTGPTGNYLNETVVPAMALIKAGYNLVPVTPNGTKPHIDEACGQGGVPCWGVVPEGDQPGDPSRAVVRFYSKRGTAEQWIEEGKQAAKKMTRLSWYARPRFRV